MKKKFSLAGYALSVFLFLCSGLRRWLGFFLRRLQLFIRPFKREFIFRHKRVETRRPQARRMSIQERRKKGRVGTLIAAAAAAATCFHSRCLPPALQIARRPCGLGLANACFCFISFQCLFFLTRTSSGREISFLLLLLRADGIVFGYPGTARCGLFPLSFLCYNSTAAVAFELRFLPCKASGGTFEVNIKELLPNSL